MSLHSWGYTYSTPIIQTEASEGWEKFCKIKDEFEKCELNLKNEQAENLDLKEEEMYQTEGKVNISENKTNLMKFLSDNKDYTFNKAENEFVYSETISTKTDWQENSVKMENTENFGEELNNRKLVQDTKIEIIENPLENKLDNKNDVLSEKEIKNSKIKTCNNDRKELFMLNRLYMHGIGKIHSNSCFNDASAPNKSRSNPKAKPLFECQECHKKYGRKSSVDTHIVAKHITNDEVMSTVTNKIHSCELCKYKSVSISGFRYHLRVHKSVKASVEADKKYCCNLCDYRTARNSNFKVHIKRHSSLKPFSCKMCIKQFKLKQQLEAHIVAIHSENQEAMNNITHKVHSCEFCSYKAIQRCKLKDHLKIHNCVESDKKFRCDLCDYRTLHNSNLKVHMKSHTSLKPISCEICIKKFDSKRHLDAHIVAEHSENRQAMNNVTSKVHSCETCNYKTLESSHFKNHLQTHKYVESDQIFLCNICDYSTLRKRNLRVHIKSHSSLKPFSCQVCIKKFNSKRHLDTHIVAKHSDNEQAMITVTGKINSCEMCSYKTVDSSKFKNHSHTHKLKQKKHLEVDKVSLQHKKNMKFYVIDE